MAKKKKKTKRTKAKLRRKPAGRSRAVKRRKVRRTVRRHKPKARRKVQPVVKKARKIKPVRRKTRKAALKPVRAVRRGDRYALNPDFEFYEELRTLILKSSPAEKGKMISRISGLGRIKLAVISGIFLTPAAPGEALNSVADLLIVGDDINRDKLRLFLKSLEAEVGSEIKFTLMDKEEFSYRHGMFDRFVRVLLEGPHEKIINRLGI